MVKLTEVEDEHFVEKPGITGEGALFAEDDDDYTDTDSSISDDDLPSTTPLDNETLSERLLALRDIIPPSARARISSVSSTLYSTTSSSISWGGKGLWALCTTVLLLGMPYALAIGAEQEMMEVERQQSMMAEGTSGMIQPVGETDGGRSAL